ncbi:MAG TPA: tyrosine-type recombinase/integrase [Bacteroidia bacterium]|nr:tyrosine-type recombinase/integrase [Bacteroidia bacterium]
MARKNQLTACSPLPWSQTIKLIETLKENGDYRFSLLIALGIYAGLRISDMLNLRWNQIINSDILDLQERKTGKIRRVYLNENLQKLIRLCYKKITEKNPIVISDSLVFINRFNAKVISVQYVDRKLAILFKQNQIFCRNYGSHSLRKTFGKQVFEMHGSTEASLILLSDLFNHASTKTTRRYIGLEQEKFQQAYMSL